LFHCSCWYFNVEYFVLVFFRQTYAVVTSFSEQTKKVVKLNTEDHEPEAIERGSPIKNGCRENIFVIFVLSENNI